MTGVGVGGSGVSRAVSVGGRQAEGPEGTKWPRAWCVRGAVKGAREWGTARVPTLREGPSPSRAHLILSAPLRLGFKSIGTISEKQETVASAVSEGKKLK